MLLDVCLFCIKFNLCSSHFFRRSCESFRVVHGRELAGEKCGMRRDSDGRQQRQQGGREIGEKGLDGMESGSRVSDSRHCGEQGTYG